MATTNTLTGLIPDLYQAMDTVARELTGMIPAVTLNASAERAAKDSKIRSFVAPASAAEDATAAQLPPDTGGQAIGTNWLTISKSKVVPFQWTGEEQLQVAPGHGHRAIAQDQVAQAMRTLVNLVEVDLAALHIKASRASGAAGTKMFNSGLGDAANARRILVDNGAPAGDLQLVMDTYAGANLRTQVTIPNTSDGGALTLREQGLLIPLFGMATRESAAIKGVAIGSVSGTLASLVRAAGVTVLTTTADYSATILPGDILTFAGDANQYVVASISAAAITIGAPGLVAGTTTGTKAITVVATAVRSMAFHRSAIQLGLRTPAVPAEGDAADDRITLTDPRTGVAFELAMYKQYRRVRYEVGLAWGCEVMKTEFLALALGLAG